MFQANGACQLGRRENLFMESPELGLDETVTGQDLERLWKRWARHEEMKRYCLSRLANCAIYR
jgi:hypothetical protein